jgi:hypothetical protein
MARSCATRSTKARCDRRKGCGDNLERSAHQPSRVSAARSEASPAIGNRSQPVAPELPPRKQCSILHRRKLLEILCTPHRIALTGRAGLLHHDCAPRLHRQGSEAAAGRKTRHRRFYIAADLELEYRRKRRCGRRQDDNHCRSDDPHVRPRRARHVESRAGIDRIVRKTFTRHFGSALL